MAMTAQITASAALDHGRATKMPRKERARTTTGTLPAIDAPSTACSARARGARYLSVPIDASQFCPSNFMISHSSVARSTSSRQRTFTVYESGAERGRVNG